MNSTELEQAAQQIKASQHPAATEIADLLDHTAHILAAREKIWTMCEYSQTIQKDLTQAHFGKEIAIAQALTAGDK